MNARLKQLAMAGGMPLDKVQALIDRCGGDELWIESILRNATTAEKAAMLSGVAYKAIGPAPAPTLKDLIETALTNWDGR